MMPPTLVCPSCKTPLQQDAVLAHCTGCEKSFGFQHGILCFGDVDEFYEGRFTETRGWSSNGGGTVGRLLKLINRSLNIGAYEARFFSRQMKRLSPTQQHEILDFGCGGGNALLAAYGTVTGVDLSVGSLLQARKIYSHVYQIDGQNLPFSDASFDLVYTSHVFGHIPAGQKPAVITEIFRVLKAGGHLISSIECDSDSFVYRRAKRHPTLFSRCFIEPWGHFGLEPPSANFQRFRQAGFNPVIESADIHKGYLRPVASYRNLLEYKGVDAVLYWMAWASDLVSKSRLMTAIIDQVFGLMIPVAYIFTPPSHRDSAKVVYRKPK